MSGERPQRLDQEVLGMRMLITMLLALAALAAPAPAFDKVLLKDGRLIEGKLLESELSGYITLRLPGADIPIAESLVERTYVEDLETYVPKDKREEEYLAKGWVKFEDRWMSRTRRETELKKRKEAEAAAIEKLRHEQQWRNRKKFTTRHFAIESNLPQDLLDEYVNRLEAYYDYFTDFWAIKRSPAEAKTKLNVFLYRTRLDFYAVTGMPYGVAGFWSFPKKELHLFHDQEDPEQSLDTLFHEGNHMLTWLIDPGFEYPRWMNEGMAEYYGTAHLTEKNGFEVGGLQYGRIVSLRMDEVRKDVVPLRKLFDATAREYGYQMYAPGWSFVHFLMQSERYANAFKSFFRNLPKNRDLKIENIAYRDIQGATLATPTLASVVASLEKTLGRSVQQLEEEWREWQTQAYGELTPRAYLQAARQVKVRMPGMEGAAWDEAILQSFEYYQKAIDMGLEDSAGFREYAEMLRKGGIDSGGGAVAIVREPDQAKAWPLIERAIDLDPVNALNYCEAGGILIMDGPLQDLDRAEAMVMTARALSRPGTMAWELTDELMALIEPAKEKRRQAEARRAELAAMDRRVWMLQKYFTSDQTPPEPVADLSTGDVRELLRAGTFGGNDFIFQSYRDEDPETGELLSGSEPWDLGWVAVHTVPDFAEDLAAAGWTPTGD